MVKINYCPSCGYKLSNDNLKCPLCNLNIEKLITQKDEDFDEDGDNLNNPNIQVKSGDDIVIVVPEDNDEDELVIDLDKLGIDVENLDDNINIVVQLENEDSNDDVADDDNIEPNEWYFDDDPYDIVYYEFP